jgi:membrane protein DedA with SNARE-associated domain
MIYTCLGAGVWNAVLVGIGLIFHSQIGKEELIAKISHYSHIIGYTAIALVIAIVVFFIYQGTKKSK